MIISNNDNQPPPRLQLPVWVKRAGVVGMLLVFIPLGFILVERLVVFTTGNSLVDGIFSAYCGSEYLLEINLEPDEIACGLEQPVLLATIGVMLMLLGTIVLITLWFYRIFLLLRYR